MFCLFQPGSEVSISVEHVFAAELDEEKREFILNAHPHIKHVLAMFDASSMEAVIATNAGKSIQLAQICCA